MNCKFTEVNFYFCIEVFYFMCCYLFISGSYYIHYFNTVMYFVIVNKNNNYFVLFCLLFSSFRGFRGWYCLLLEVYVNIHCLFWTMFIRLSLEASRAGRWLARSYLFCKQLNWNVMLRVFSNQFCLIGRMWNYMKTSTF